MILYKRSAKKNKVVEEKGTLNKAVKIFSIGLL